MECVFGNCKVFMYEFHYDYIRNKYDNKSKLLFTDTDSLMYEIKIEDVYEDFSDNKEIWKNERLNRWCCNEKILSDWSQRCIRFW